MSKPVRIASVGDRPARFHAVAIDRDGNTVTTVSTQFRKQFRAYRALARRYGVAALVGNYGKGRVNVVAYDAASEEAERPHLLVRRAGLHLPGAPA